MIGLDHGRGSLSPLDDALRIAFTELIAWMQTRLGLSQLDSYELLSKVSEDSSERDGGSELRYRGID